MTENEKENIEEKRGALDEIPFIAIDKKPEKIEIADFEFIKKPPIEAPAIKDVEDIDVSDSVDRDINKQLGIKTGEGEKEKEKKGERKDAYNVGFDDLLLQHLYEMVNSLLNLLAEMIGEPELNTVKEAKEENMVIARVLYRYSGKMKRETLDSIQFVLVIFKKIARTKWFKKAVEKRMSKAQ